MEIDKCLLLFRLSQLINFCNLFIYQPKKNRRIRCLALQDIFAGAAACIPLKVVVLYSLFQWKQPPVCDLSDSISRSYAILVHRIYLMETLSSSISICCLGNVSTCGYSAENFSNALLLSGYQDQS